MSQRASRDWLGLCECVLDFTDLSSTAISPKRKRKGLYEVVRPDFVNLRDAFQDLAALRMAIAHRVIQPGLVYHSD